MSVRKDAPKPRKLEAVCVVRSKDDILCTSYALTIVDGVVVDSLPLTRASDLPAVSIGLAQRALWSQMRVNRDLPFEEETKEGAGA